MRGIALAVHGGAGSLERDEDGRRGDRGESGTVGAVARDTAVIGAEGTPRVRLFADE